MKFTSLHEALKKWDENDKKKHHKVLQESASLCDKKKPTDRSPIRQRAGDKVVGGTILWKPIDRAAAMLLSKAPWWAQPIYEKNKAETPKPNANPLRTPKNTATHNQIDAPKKVNPKKGNNMSIKLSSGNPHPMQEGETFYEKKSNDQMNSEIASKFVSQTDNTVNKTEALLERVIDARATMDSLCDTWKASWLEFQDGSDERLKNLRMTRMSMESEMRQMMGSFREVRGFFMDKDYELERSRLKEFVELCERLQKLKESGFLDSVADVMLRLGEQHTL